MDCKTCVHIDQVGLQQKMKIVITPLIIWEIIAMELICVLCNDEH